MANFLYEMCSCGITVIVVHVVQDDEHRYHNSLQGISNRFTLPRNLQEYNKLLFLTFSHFPPL